MGSTTRITGMYSGLDTESLVQELISASKAPLNNYQREKTEVEWQRETLLDLNKELLELQNYAKDMQQESSFKVYTAESTNSRVATASATKDALEGTYTIKTMQLATTSTFTSTPVSENTRISSIQSKDFVDYFSSLSKTAFNITLNGQTKTIVFGEDEGNFDFTTDVAAIFQKKIDDAFGANQINVKSETLPFGYTIGFECGDNALQLPITVTSIDEETKNKLKDELGYEVSDALAADKLNIESGSTNIFDTSTTIAKFLGTSATEIEFTVNGKKQTISTQTTITDFFKKINNSNQDVNVKYDPLSDSVIMRRESSGAGRDLRIGDNLGLFNALGLMNTADMSEEAYEIFKKNDSRYQEGQNAIVSITDPEGRKKEATIDENGEIRGGLQLTSNSFTYEGVNFNLSKINPNEEVSITVAKDVDTVFDNVVEFVDKYNNVLGKLNELVNEKPNRSYDPLLDEERDELSDSQQEKWDKLARQGILYRDSTLSSAVSSMRNAVTSILSTNSEISSLFQIGINTTAYNPVGNDNGKLVIDEEKLREAISNNMDEVASLFTSKPEYISGTVIPGGTTIAQGSSFKISVNGREETITFDKDYDLSDATQKSKMISDINSVLTAKFGSKNIVMAISSDRIILTSQKGNSVTVNSGDGVDALAALGLEDGATYDAKALGFANKINTLMGTIQENIIDKAGASSTAEDESTLGERMSQLNKYISKQQEKLDLMEDRYYAQFAAMENALAQLESQSSYIANMLGGGGSMM